MLRGTEIVRQWPPAAVIDQVVLDHEGRHRRRILLHGLKGTEFLLDLADVPDMRDGDGILLSTGKIVLVNAADEPLMEVRSADPLKLARIAWHVGNRHLAAEIAPGLIRLRADYAGAIAAGAERYRESNAQGRAFTEITIATWGSPTLVEFCASYPRAVPFPVAVGVAAADHHIALGPALHAYVHAFTANLVSASVRLVPLGHTDGQRALMQLESSVACTVAQGETGDLSLLCNAAILADMASMQHETQHTRLFRS